MFSCGATRPDTTVSSCLYKHTAVFVNGEPSPARMGRSLCVPLALGRPFAHPLPYRNPTLCGSLSRLRRGYFLFLNGLLFNCFSHYSIGRRKSQPRFFASAVGEMIGVARIVGHAVALGDEVHKAVCRRGGRHAAQRAHDDRARRNPERGPQRQNDAASEPGL